MSTQGDNLIARVAESMTGVVCIDSTGRITIDGQEVSPAMAEKQIRQTMNGPELDRALAAFRNLIKSH